jgi:hypothetical protein
MNDLTNISQKRTPSNSIRLAARITGTLWVLICLFIFFGNVIEQSNKSTGDTKPPDILGIATVVCLLIALGGLIIAWWREGIGGFISFFGIIIAGALLIIDPKLDFSLPVFAILLVPSILYLAYWWDAKKSSVENPKP